MKLFTFAIASIVDANTGHGLSARKHLVDYEAAKRHAHGIRSNSVHAVFAALKASLGRLVEDYRARLQERRDLRRLLSMNDRLLRDIGITRGDLIAVEMGSLTLAELYAERERRRGGDTLVETAPATGKLDITDAAVNEQSYIEKKCA